MEGKSNITFPIVTGGETAQRVQSCLFPVHNDNIGSTSDISETKEADNLDWLENRSFLPSSALLAQGEKESSIILTSSLHNSPTSSTSSGTSDKSCTSKIKNKEDTDQNLIHTLSASDDEDSSKKEKKRLKHSHKKVKEKKRKKKKKRKNKKSRCYSPTSDLKRKSDSSVDFWKNHPGKTFLEEIPGLEPEFAFRIDRKADKTLWDYDSIYKGHIARFYPFTDKCLGSSVTLLSDKTNKGTGLSVRYFIKDRRKDIRAKGQTVRVDKTQEMKTLQYISVQDKDQNRLQLSDSHVSNPLGILDPATSFYIQGKSSDKTQTEEKELIIMDETFDKIAYYNKCLHDDPSNIKLWMEFVSFQDYMFQDAKFSSAQTFANRRLRETFQPPLACIEKKLAILDKALISNPSSLKLKITKLELQQDVTDSSTLAKEWDKLLFTHSGDVRLWRHYLAFRQSRLSTFMVGNMIKLYHRCFKSLSPILEGKVNVVKVTENLENEMIDLFAQYCSFLHQCGFTEKAVASYQALIEFNMFRPTSLNLAPTADCVAVFESFWDSGVARFGEPGAAGWAAFIDGITSHNSSVNFSQVSTEEEQEEILSKDAPLWQTWLSIELLRQSAHWLPWRPDITKGETEEDCEDLDRLVLYEDVAPVLFRLQLSASCPRIVNLMLELLGLVPGSELSLGYHHGYRVLEFEQLKLCTLHQLPAVSGLDCGISADASWNPRAEIVMFAEEVLRQAADYFTGWQRTIFVRDLLHLQKEKHGTDNVKSLKAGAVKKVQKYGKNLLKETQNRNELMVWDAYIRNEWALGNTKDALSMLSMALTMFSDSVPSDDYLRLTGLCALFHTYTEIQLNFQPLELVQPEGRRKSPSQEAKNNVLGCFQILVDHSKFVQGKGKQPPSFQILRIRKKFQSVTLRLVEDSETWCDVAKQQYLIQFVKCFALFELCASNIDDALQVYTDILQVLYSVQSSAATSAKKTITTPFKIAVQDLRESITLCQVSLLKNYMLVEVVSLAKMRGTLDTALSHFPDNSWLLRQLLDLEAQTHIAGRLHRYFEIGTKDPGSPYPVLFEVLAEMGRHAKLQNLVNKEYDVSTSGAPYTGTVHRVRAVCERGLRHRVALHCPLLWRLYLKFEAKYGSLERAKGIFYRALQNCPCAKILYLDGAQLFGAEQFQELIDLLTEKELRVQIPQEEVELLMNSEPQEPALSSGEPPDGIFEDNFLIISELHDSETDFQKKDKSAELLLSEKSEMGEPASECLELSCDQNISTEQFPSVKSEKEYSVNEFQDQPCDCMSTENLSLTKSEIINFAPALSHT